MSRRLIGALRVCTLVLRVVLMAALVTWAICTPLAWIMRDGLAAGMVETTGWQAVVKFLGLWGIPALALAAPLAGLWLLDRWLAVPARESGREEEGDDMVLMRNRAGG